MVTILCWFMSMFTLMVGDFSNTRNVTCIQFTHVSKGLLSKIYLKSKHHHITNDAHQVNSSSILNVTILLNNQSISRKNSKFIQDHSEKRRNAFGFVGIWTVAQRQHVVVLIPTVHQIHNEFIKNQLVEWMILDYSLWEIHLRKALLQCR